MEHLDPKVLGQILLLQSTLAVAPDSTTLGEQTCHALRAIPGLMASALRVHGQVLAAEPSGVIPLHELPQSLEPHPTTSSPTQQPWIEVLPLQTCRANYGQLILAIADRKEFRPYASYLQNTSNMIALVVENLIQASELQELNKNLEAQVYQRTKELQESEERNRLVIQASNEGVWDWDLKTDFVYYSPRWKEILGYADSELENHINTWLRTIHPDDLEIAQQRLDDHFREDQPFSHTSRFFHKDGSLRWVQVNGFALRDETGKPYRMIGNHRDITERKQAEEALRASEEKYRLVVENAHDAIFIAQDGCIKFPNRRLAVLSGYSLEELTQIPFLESVHPEDRDLVAAMHHGRIRGEEVPTTYSFRVMSKTGETSWVELSSVLIPWEGKAASLNFLRDITVQRKLESQLRQAQKMEAIGTLAGGIAHDFNNILSAIMGYAELLTLFHIEKDNPARPNLEEVLIATHRAKDLVQQILAFSRQTEQEKRPVLLAPIIKEALKFLRASLPTTIEIRHFMPSPIDSVWADPTQMHQVIMNLCTNAAHAMKERGGLLEIRLERIELGLQARERFHDLAPGPYVRLAVTDTGLGMSREIMERIFDPYFTTKKLGEGTGLGLAVVHGIIKNHGGLIGVDSELGKGTTFEVLLPRLKGEEPTSAEKTEKRLPVGTECILFVDDEQSIVDIGRGILERLGYEVVGETNPSVALETFEAHPQRFHLVVTDLTMPHMTGLQLAEKLILMRADIPIILCTGLGDQSAKKEAKAIGIKKFVHKPISVYKLADTVREILNERLQEFPRSTWPTS